MEQLTDLVVARRVMLQTQQLIARQQGKDVKIQSAKEAMEEDQLLLSGEAQAAQPVGQAAQGPSQENARINLAELGQRLKDLQAGGDGPSQPIERSQFVLAYQRTETQVSVRYRSLPYVDGLVLRDKNYAETDRYGFDFIDGASFKITDKWSGKSTTVWGDPHIDTSDQEGNVNGEFGDLKASNDHTTMMLEDGTRVTFTAQDSSLINRLDIFKGQQHLGGTGAASPDWKVGSGLFESKVDTQSENLLSVVPAGDVVYAGGDGADWFDASGRLVWGKVTGPHITSRPSSILEVEVSQQTSQGVIAGIG